MSWKEFLTRHHPWFLVILLLVIAGIRFPIQSPEVRALPVAFQDSDEDAFYRWCLFEKSLPVVSRLQRGEPITDRQDSLSRSQEDPREALLYLWDELSKEERGNVLRELGYPADAGPRQLLKGPHPAWFGRKDIEWQ
jgi:hypothetical protein